MLKIVMYASSVGIKIIIGSKLNSMFVLVLSDYYI